LPKSLKGLESEATNALDWNPMSNPAIRGTIKHSSQSQYLEDIADILYHFDIMLISISQYFDALNIASNESYEHLMLSISISKKMAEFVNEFLIINSSML